MADALKARLDLFKYLGMDNTVSFTSFTLDGTTDACGAVFQVEKAMVITQVGFRVNTITGVPGELTVSLQSLDASGYPSGTILGGGSPASVAIASPSASFTAAEIYWATLSNTYSAVAGEMMAMVLDPTAGTWATGTEQLTISVVVIGFGVQRPGTPYGVQCPSGTWARVNGYPVYGITSGTDTQGLPLEDLNANTIDSGTAINQYGFAFTLPAGWSSTFKLRGVIWALAKQQTATQTFDVVLYDSDGTTELQVMNYNSEHHGTTATGATYRNCDLFFDETTLSTLTFGTKYYIFIRPLTTSGDLNFNDFGYRRAADLQALPLGENCFLCSKATTATAPVELTTRRPLVGLIFDDITEPTGGAGGMIVHPGMNGRMV